MIYAEEAWRVAWQFFFRAVRENVRRARSDCPAPLENVEVGIPRDFAESKNGAGLQNLEFALQVASAVQHFLRQRLVVGRSAAARGGNVDALQAQTVVAAHRSWLVSEAGFVQGGIEEIAGAITGEDAAGAIAPVRGRSKSENQQLG